MAPEHASKRLVPRCSIRVPRPVQTDCIMQLNLHMHTYRRDLHTGVRARMMDGMNCWSIELPTGRETTKKRAIE